MLLLVDISRIDKKLHDLHNKASWWKRLEASGWEIMLWHNQKDNLFNSYNVASSWKELRKHAEKRGIHHIVYIEADQLFLDLDEVSKGLSNSGEEWDYFTQWEHCRLPVGMGIRAFSLNNKLIAEWDNSPHELISFIQGNPNLFSIKYDAHKYVNYELSRLDSRYKAGNAKLLHSLNDNYSYSLKGFLDLVSKNKESYFIYNPEWRGKFVDERLMPAAFGFESEECAEFPTYIMFDITNICNSRCVHCPHSTVLSEKRTSATYLDGNYFKKVIDECQGRNVQFIRITADGEPLLHPDLVKMLSYASARIKGRIGLTTNGALLNKNLAQKLIDAGLFMVDFSLDAFKEETYKKIRRGLNYADTIKNINDFISLKNEIKPDFKVMVSFVKQESNMGEVEEFKNYWEPLVDKVLIREMISNVNLVNVPKGSIQKYSGKRWPCPHFFRRIVVNYDGLIKACPVDWETKTAFRSVTDIDIYSAWHSDYYWNNRMEHLNNTFSQNTICKNCEDWMGSPWDLGYEKVIRSL